MMLVMTVTIVVQRAVVVTVHLSTQHPTCSSAGNMSHHSYSADSSRIIVNMTLFVYKLTTFN
jgi:Mg2+ and Co2+ transporter CorA